MLITQDNSVYLKKTNSSSAYSTKYLQLIDVIYIVSAFSTHLVVYSHYPSCFQHIQTNMQGHLSRWLLERRMEVGERRLKVKKSWKHHRGNISAWVMSLDLSIDFVVKQWRQQLPRSHTTYVFCSVLIERPLEIAYHAFKWSYIAKKCYCDGSNLAFCPRPLTSFVYHISVIMMVVYVEK